MGKGKVAKQTKADSSASSRRQSADAEELNKRKKKE